MSDASGQLADQPSIPSGADPGSRLIEESSSLLDAFDAVQAADDQRGNEGNRVGDLRTQLWRSWVAAPITDFVGRWGKAWTELRQSLCSGDIAAGGESFATIDRLLVELQGIESDSTVALDKWYSEDAKTYNTRYASSFRFERCWQGGSEPAWLYFRWRTRSDSGKVFSDFGRRVTTRIPQHQWAYDEYRKPLRIVLLFALLGTGKSTTVFQTALSKFPNLNELAKVCPVLSAVALPVPGILQQFLDSAPSDEEFAIAQSILWWSTGVIGDRLRDEFKEICAERQRLAHVARVPDVIPQVAPATSAVAFSATASTGGGASQNPPAANGVRWPDILVHDGLEAIVTRPAAALLNRMLRGGGSCSERTLLEQLYSNKTASLTSHCYQANVGLKAVNHPRRLRMMTVPGEGRYICWCEATELRQRKAKPAKNQKKTGRKPGRN